MIEKIAWSPLHPYVVNMSIRKWFQWLLTRSSKSALHLLGSDSEEGCYSTDFSTIMQTLGHSNVPRFGFKYISHTTITCNGLARRPSPSHNHNNYWRPAGTRTGPLVLLGFLLLTWPSCSTAPHCPTGQLHLALLAHCPPPGGLVLLAGRRPGHLGFKESPG